MSAPMTRDPLAVTTGDGIAWTRRAVTRGGRGLYAPSDVTGCPAVMLATLDELAEHGLQGQATAEPSECEQLRTQVAALLAERHTTNDALAKLDEQRAAALAGHVRHADSEHCQADGEPWPCPTVEALTTAPAKGRPPVVVDGYPPTFPWARWLDETDLPAFLDELAAAAITHASSARALAEVEQTCAIWRPIADSFRAYLTEPPALVTSYAEQSAARLRKVLAPSDGGERP